METLAEHPAHTFALERLLRRVGMRLREAVHDMFQPRVRRSLQVKETVDLGERRFVAVVQCEQQRFLIGGSANSVTLLATLPNHEQGEKN